MWFSSLFSFVIIYFIYTFLFSSFYHHVLKWCIFRKCCFSFFFLCLKIYSQCESKIQSLWLIIATNSAFFSLTIFYFFHVSFGYFFSILIEIQLFCWRWAFCSTNCSSKMLFYLFLDKLPRFDFFFFIIIFFFRSLDMTDMLWIFGFSICILFMLCVLDGEGERKAKAVLSADCVWKFEKRKKKKQEIIADWSSKLKTLS